MATQPATQPDDWVDQPDDWVDAPTQQSQFLPFAAGPVNPNPPLTSQKKPTPEQAKLSTDLQFPTRPLLNIQHGVNPQTSAAIDQFTKDHPFIAAPFNAALDVMSGLTSPLALATMGAGMAEPGESSAPNEIPEPTPPAPMSTEPGSALQWGGPEEQPGHLQNIKNRYQEKMSIPQPTMDDKIGDALAYANQHRLKTALSVTGAGGLGYISYLLGKLQR